jgi:hypothetical protein
LAGDGWNDAAEIRRQTHERTSSRPEAVADRHLGVHEALADEVDGENLGVVVVVDDRSLGGGSAAERAVPALAIGDRLAGDPAQRGGQGDIAEPAMRRHRVDDAGEAAAHDVVGGAGEDWSGQPGQLLRGVFAIGVTERHDRRATINGRPQPDAHGGPETDVAIEPDHRGAGQPGHLGGSVGGAVVDDKAPRRETADSGRHSTDHVANTAGLVVCRQHETDVVAAGEGRRATGHWHRRQPPHHPQGRVAPIVKGALQPRTLPDTFARCSSSPAPQASSVATSWSRRR